MDANQHEEIVFGCELYAIEHASCKNTSFMFERYTEPARRAIFFARAIMLADQGPALDAVHILRGLMWPDRSRAETLFQLREKFPNYCLGPKKWAMYTAMAPPNLLLTDEAKKILFFAAKEADEMGDAWVDTDQLLLGILCVLNCAVAQELINAGVTLETARLRIAESRTSRPNYGPIIPLGKSPSPRVWLISRWHWWNARRSEKRFIAQWAE